MERPVLPSTKTPWFRYPEDLDPVLRDIRDNLDVLDSDVDDIQSGALPIALAGIEGALGAYEPLQNMRAGVVNVLDEPYGAVGDGVADDTAAIQAAEDAASLLGVAAGASVDVVFPAGKTFAVSSRLVKKSYTRWTGGGQIVRKDAAAPTGANFAIVYANDVDYWAIDGIHIENLPLSLVESAGITSSTSGWVLNAGVIAIGCEWFSIRNCRIERYTYGIIHQGCRHYSIVNNAMRAIHDPAKDRSVYQADMLDNTYEADYPNGSTASSGAIVVFYDAAGPPPGNSDYLIANNQIENYGLNTGIDGLSQTFDESPGVIANNVIEGGRAGIQSYRGSFSDPGTAPTWDAHVLVTGNNMSWLWEQGIYLRSSYGYLVVGNYMRHVALVGTNGSGSSAGGIVTRVDPIAFTSPLNNPTPVQIIGNQIVDAGSPTTGLLDGGIQVRLQGTVVRGNTVSRSEIPTWGGLADYAILVGNGENIESFVVSDNVISGYHVGVFIPTTLWTDAARPNPPLADWRITDNVIRDCGVHGINADPILCGGSISRNQIMRCGTEASGAAIRVKRAPYCEIAENVIDTSTSGIAVASGCLASDEPHIRSGGAITRAIRRGGTLVVRNNRLSHVDTSHVVTETSVVEANFYARCAVWEGDLVDGYPVYQTFTSAPTSSYSAKTWNKGDQAPHGSPASGSSPGWVVTASGTFGDTTTTTGDTTNGSPVVSSVASLDGLGRGIYITLTGFSGPQKIIDIDVDNDTITLGSNASSTNVGATIAPATPTFAAMAVLV